MSGPFYVDQLTHSRQQAICIILGYLGAGTLAGFNRS